MDKGWQKRVIGAGVTFLFFFCAIYANFYAIKKMERYAGEVYFYDKLQVALQFGGISGLNEELNRIFLFDQQKRQRALAEEFKQALPGLKNPGEYLADIVSQRKAKIRRIKNFRQVAMMIIIAIFCWRLYAGCSVRFKHV